MMMFENAYLILNKRTSYYIKILLFLIISTVLFITFYEYPKTTYYNGLVVESDGDRYIEVITTKTNEITNDYMMLIIDEQYFNYRVKKIELLNINTTLYYKLLLYVDTNFLTNEEVDFNIYLGKTTILKELIKNLKKGMLYGQT